MQSIDTDDSISANRQWQVPRTGTAQWQDPGDVSCDATQVPMNQKMQKTVEILQVHHIDKVIEVLQAQLIDDAVEVPEIMQRHDPMIQKVEDAQKTINKAEAQLSRVRNSADTGSSERKRTLQ